MVVCSACGTTVSDGSKFCGGCGRQLTAMVMPVQQVQPKQTSIAGTVLLVLIVIAIVTVTISYTIGISTANVSRPFDTGSSAPRDPCHDNAFAYLLALKEGKAIGAAFWKPGVPPVTLFAVQEFDEIKSGDFLQSNMAAFKVPRRYVQYAVVSSTKGGFPIRKRWNVILEPSSKNYGNEGCAIVGLKEAE